MAPDTRNDDSITMHEGHPAVNVKVHCAYLWEPRAASDSAREYGWDTAARWFWDAATACAHKRGYSGVFAEGRSGGWCVPFYQSQHGKVIQFNNWPGQSPKFGYPYYPDVEHNGADRERFKGFQRDIRKLLDSAKEIFGEATREFMGWGS